MSTTELGEVEALLEKVLPDPRGFAERVFEQLMERLSVPPPGMAAPVIDSYDAAAHQALADRNVILAAALGACDCWGFEADCPACAGEGTAGWTEPDPALFGEFVGPAVTRMAASADIHADSKEGAPA